MLVARECAQDGLGQVLSSEVSIFARRHRAAKFEYIQVPIHKHRLGHVEVHAVVFEFSLFSPNLVLINDGVLKLSIVVDREWNHSWNTIGILAARNAKSVALAVDHL